MTKPHEVAWSENSAQVTTQAIPIAIDLRGGVLEVAGGFTDCIQRSMDFILKNDGIHTEMNHFTGRGAREPYHPHCYPGQRQELRIAISIPTSFWNFGKCRDDGESPLNEK